MSSIDVNLKPLIEVDLTPVAPVVPDADPVIQCGVVLDEFKIQIGVDLNDSSQDAELTQYLQQATAIASRETRKNFKIEEIVEERNGMNTSELVLRKCPVVSVSEVRLRCSPTVNRFGSFSRVTEDDYIILERGIDYDIKGSILRRLCGLWWPARHESPIGLVGWTERPGECNIRVTYTAGYAEMPDDIKGAVMTVAAAIRDSAPTGGRTIASESLDYYSVSYNASNSGGGGAGGSTAGLALNDAKRVFASYRMPLV